jgi:hypothetical protein
MMVIRGDDMYRRTYTILMASLLLVSLCASVVGNNSGGEVPDGEGVRIAWFSTVIVTPDEPCWLRLGSVEMFYPRAIPDLKEYFETQKVARPQAYFEIYVDDARVSPRMIEYYTTWMPVDPDMFSGMPIPPEDADARWRTCLVQFPGGYFVPREEEYVVTVVAGWRSQSAYAPLAGWDNPFTIWGAICVED